MDSNYYENNSIESVDEKQSLLRLLNRSPQKNPKKEKSHMKQTVYNYAQNWQNSISSDDEPLAISNNYSLKRHKRIIASDFNSDSDSDLNAQLYSAEPTKRRKHNSVKNVFEKKKYSKKMHNISENSSPISDIKKALCDMKEELFGLSKSTTVLEEEVALYRVSASGNCSSNTFYTSKTLPKFPTESNGITFNTENMTVTVPITEVEDVDALEKLLADKTIFNEVLAYIGVIYGTEKDRVTWKHARRLLYALISKSCFANFTWSGKGNKLVFKKFELINDVLFTALQKINMNYDEKQYKDDMVKHVVKRAHEHAENKQK